MSPPVNNQRQAQYTKFFLWFAVGLGLSGLVITRGLAQTSGDVIDRIVAIVGNQVILESEVLQNAQIFALQQNLDPVKEPEKFLQLEGRILQELINQKILLAKAREDTLTVEPRVVDREIENRLQNIIKNAGSEERVEERYGKPLNRLRREIRPLVEEDLLVEKLKQNRLAGVTIPRGEVEQYYNDHPELFPAMNDGVELEHILREVSSSGRATERARLRADSIYQALRAGAAFDSLAFQLSEDPSSAKKFGRIGWTEPGDLLSDYENAASALQIGEISRPIKTQLGFHLIRLDAKEDTRISTSHILIRIKVQPEDEQTILDSLIILRQEIVAGLSFEDAARRFSEDLSSATRGGRLGWFDVTKMPEDFRAAVDSLQIGQVSQPFKTQYGFHLVKVLNRRPARPLNLEQDWEEISREALNAKLDRDYQHWLENLKARYYIEIKH